MNDQGLHTPKPIFDASILGLCLIFALGLIAKGQTGDWYSGFIPAQEASKVLPPWLWESLTTLGDGRAIPVFSGRSWSAPCWPAP